MPQIKQPGTDNILANWQGFYTESEGGFTGLVVRAAFQCTLKRSAAGVYNLSILPTFMDDENMAICVDFLDNSLPETRVQYNVDGTATLTVTAGEDVYDPGLFNIVVYQCTDFVSIIEGPPSNP